MKPANILFTLIFLFGLTSATDFNIISPWGSTTWKSGTNVVVVWSVLTSGASPDAPDVSKVNLDLMQGDFTNANLVAHIANNLDVNMDKYSWQNVPDYPAGTNYFVRVGTDAWWRYSHSFTFVGKGTVKSLAQPAYNGTNQNNHGIAAGPDNSTTTLTGSNSTNPTSSSSNSSPVSSGTTSPSATSSKGPTSNTEKITALTKANSVLLALSLTVFALLSLQ